MALEKIKKILGFVDYNRNVRVLDQDDVEHEIDTRNLDHIPQIESEPILVKEVMTDLEKGNRTDEQLKYMNFKLFIDSKQPDPNWNSPRGILTSTATAFMSSSSFIGW